MVVIKAKQILLKSNRSNQKIRAILSNTLIMIRFKAILKKKKNLKGNNFLEYLLKWMRLKK